MRAAVYPGGGKPLVLECVPDPEPGPGDVVIKVGRCGICGTDLHLTSGHAFDFKAGSIPGHEYAGEIVAVGAGVTGLRLGELVTAEPSPGCGQCEACRRGNFPLCLAMPGTMGGFAEYLRAPAELTVKLPSTLSLADGALVEPLAIGLNGVKLARLRASERVLVLGAGSIAMTTIYWARRLGAGRIVAMSRSPRRREMALSMGADAFVPYGEGEVQEVAEALGGPPDAVFECVGNSGFIAKGVSHVRQFGRVLSLASASSRIRSWPRWRGSRASPCSSRSATPFATSST